MYDVVIVDGNNMANKAFFLNNYLSYEIDGKIYKTGVLYGMLTMMLSAVKSGLITDKSMICCVWDTPVGSIVRTEMDVKYKATRRPVSIDEIQQKADFYQQVDFAKRELFGLRFYQTEQEGYEADDLIFTIVRHVLNRNNNKRILIISEDKDFRQLISDKVHLYSVQTKLIWDESYFTKKTGIPYPSYFTDYLALVGDSSDNYDGVPGIGIKSAISILNDKMFVDKNGFSPVRLVIDNPSIINDLDITSRIKSLLIDNIDKLKLSYRLASFYEVPNIRLKHRKSESDFIENVVRRFNMKSLLSDKNIEALSKLM